MGPEDIDVVELHDATSAEELYALESLGFFPAGEAGAATAAGRHRRRRPGRVRQPERRPGGARPPSRRHRASARSPSSSPSCGGRPAGARSPSPALGAAVNTGGIMGGKDTALVGDPRARAQPEHRGRRSRHRVGHRRPRQGPHQRRPVGPPRHQRRVDHRAHRHPRAPHRRHHLRAGHRGGGRGPGPGRAHRRRHRRARARHLHARRPRAGHLGHGAGRPRRRRRRLRHQRGVLGLRVRRWWPPTAWSSPGRGACSLVGQRDAVAASPTGTTAPWPCWWATGPGRSCSRPPTGRANCCRGTSAPTGRCATCCCATTAGTST